MENTTSSTNSGRAVPGAGMALGLLLAINIFNYIDRQVLAAVLPSLKTEFLSGDPNQNGKAGLLTTAFLVSYMLLAPLFGWLADRCSRWMLVGLSVALWSLASGWSGLAGSFWILLVTRAFVGVGEAGYGPAAPTIIADLFPIERRGRALAWFYLAIPVGGALGYAYGGKVAATLGWRWAFYLVVPPGLLLAVWALFMRDPRTQAVSTEAAPKPKMRLKDALGLFRIRSYVFNTAAMTAMTFAMGGIATWMPDYIFHHRSAEFPAGPNLLGDINFTFGAITASAGLLATLLGGWLGDRLRTRFPGSYFLVSGAAIFFAFPATIGMLYLPFPTAWVLIFFAVFFLFMNTGPANTALANVTPPAMRATAFALNIFIIHAFGDAISPPLIGAIADRTSMNVAFLFVSATMVIASVLWLTGARYLPRDTAAVEERGE
jgi:MFS family permease